MNRRLISNITILATYLLIVGISLFFAYSSSNFSFLDDTNSFLIQPSDFSPDLDSSPTVEGERNYLYETQIPKSSFDAIGDEEDLFELFIYKLADNGFRLSFNGHVLGQRGDLKNGNSNLWNGYTKITIPSELVVEDNTLSLETYAVYRTGLSAFPMYMTNESISNKMNNVLTFFGSRGITFALGFLIFSILVVILLYLSSYERRNIFLLTAFSSFFIAIYCYDYLTIDYLPINYLLYKKMTMGGLYFGIAFYTYALSEYYKLPRLKWLSHLQLAFYVLIALLSSTMQVFKPLYTYGYILALCHVVTWIGLALYHVRKRRTLVFLSGFSILFTYAGLVIYIDMIGGHSKLNSPIVYISLLGIMPLLMTYEAFQEQEMAITEEKKQRNQALIDSVTDPMTGVWNQRYLLAKNSQDLIGSVICIIDLDDFKSINDTHGHMTGDIAIHELCRFINEYTRPGDDVIRYGGDEFIIIMYNTSLNEGIEVCRKILHKSQTTWIQVQETKIRISLSIGLYDVLEDRPLKELIDRADFQLYRAKANGKNQISY